MFRRMTKVEKALYTWFLETSVDGPILLEKALGEADFTGGARFLEFFLIVSLVCYCANALLAMFFVLAHNASL